MTPRAIHAPEERTNLLDFDMLGLSPTLQAAVKAAGYDTPTPIQKQAIPLALEGHDIMGLAQTGTGKTAAFGLPLVEHLMKMEGRPQPKCVKALVLAPTRELVNQIAEALRLEPGSLTAAAQRLGVSRSTLWRKRKRFGL